MHNAETYLQSYLGNHQMPISFRKRAPKIALATSCSSFRKEPTKKCKPILKPILPKKTTAHKHSQKKLQDQSTLFDEAYSQAKHYISLMEDPLWKQVCAEVLDIIGPLALQVFQAQLGAFSSQDKTVNLYCQTEEISHFVQEYNFIILGSLQRYFPTLKELRVKITSQW